MAALDSFDFHRPEPTEWPGLLKVISGGQTGADQAGLFAAYDLGLATGGQAPEGYLTVAGLAPELASFGLTAKGSYQQRTLQNVRNSDATLVLSQTPGSTGTVLTIKCCVRERKPYLLVNTAPFVLYTATRGDAGSPPSPELIASMVEFVRCNRASTVNIAGNRERHGDKRITMACYELCKQVFSELIRTRPASPS